MLPIPAARPKLDINFLSCCSNFLAIVQPALSSPTRFSFGTSTLSKNVSQNGDLPLINVIGLVETPGFSISISKKLIPLCFGSFGPVLTRAKIQSALSAYDVQTFCPFTKKWSPISSALVARLAKSDPEPGSEYP